MTPREKLADQAQTDLVNICPKLDEVEVRSSIDGFHFRGVRNSEQVIKFDRKNLKVGRRDFTTAYELMVKRGLLK